MIQSKALATNDALVSGESRDLLSTDSLETAIDLNLVLPISGQDLRRRAMPSASTVHAARAQLHRKAGIVFATVLVSYLVLLSTVAPLFVRALAFPVLLAALMMVATSIMHDANHGAFFENSERKNQLVGYASDLLGVSSVLWRLKHDVHHSDPNVQGVDPDIDQGIVARLAPNQERRWWHRYQHRYLWPLYGLLGVQWLLISDFADLRRGHVAGQTLAGLGKAKRASIFLGKVLHVSWALVLPMLWYQWWVVIPAYLVGSWAIGFVLSVTFQIAHCVDAAEFALPETDRQDTDFVWHQLATTVDVAPKPSLLGQLRTMVLGGLDCQIEHHLAPQVPHTAYPAMATKLRDACWENDVLYRSHPNVRGAIASHYRWLKAMAA